MEDKIFAPDKIFLLGSVQMFALDLKMLDKKKRKYDQNICPPYFIHLRLL